MFLGVLAVTVCLFVHVYTCSWPVRTLSFSFDSQMVASASEDLFIDIVSAISI